MFSRKLEIPDTTSIPEEVFSDLWKNYIYPGAWDEDADSIKIFKENMKTILSENQDNKCAYCELPLDTENPAIEHIAPKGGKKRVKHYQLTFTPDNLVYSCHYCNSPECKGQKNTVVSKNGTKNHRLWTYSIVHPYFDDPKEYFTYYPIEDGIDGCIPCIKPKITGMYYKKAATTIAMFKLDEKKATKIGMSKILERTAAGADSEEILKLVQHVSTYRKQ